MLSGPRGSIYGLRLYSKAVKVYAKLPPVRLKRYPVVEKDGVIYLRYDVAVGPPGEDYAGRLPASRIR